MAISTVLGLVAVLVLILLNAFFVAAEFALVAVDRSRLDAEAESGRRSARTAQALLPQLSFHLSGAQLGITITSLVLGIIAEPTVARAIDPVIEPVIGSGSASVSIAIALVLATVIQMVMGELVPKSLAIARPLRSVTLLAAPVRLYGVTAGPLIRFLNASSNATVRRMGFEPQEELASVRSLEEIALLIRTSEQHGHIDRAAAEVIRRTARFGTKSVQDALVPRVDVVGIGADRPLVDLISLSLTTGFSRFPVITGDLDDVIGVVHVKDVYRVPVEDRPSVTVQSIMTEVLAVPENRELDSLLMELGGRGSHLAIVVDEYGGTEGIITLEDIIEEIVGEIEDEHDPVPELIRPRRTGPVPVDASLHPDEVQERCGIRLPSGPYETLAGFVLAKLGRIPAVGDAFEHEGWRFRVTQMDGLRVAEVEVTAPPEGIWS